MKVYSPSASETYHENPAKYALRYIEKWVPKAIAKRDLSLWSGKAFHAGVHAYRSKLADITKACKIAYDMTEAQIHEAEEKNFQYESDLIEQVETLPALVHITLERFLNEDPIPKDWVLVASEEYWPEQACILDEVYRRPNGYLTFVDYKFKPKLDKKYHQENLLDFDQSWQMYHYNWALTERYKEKVFSYHVAMVVGQPRYVAYFQEFIVDTELMRLWRKSSEQAWKNMQDIEEGRAYPIHNFKWKSRWGKDEYTDAVLSCRLDPQLLTEKYIRKER